MNRTRQIALISLFSAISGVMQVTLAPLGFMLFGVPFLHDVSVYVPIILAMWLISRFGGALGVGILGATISFIFMPSNILVVGFALSSVLLDVLAFGIGHRMTFRLRNIAVVSTITVFSAYVAGLIIGVVFMGGSLAWAAGFWGPFHSIGAVLSLIVAYPFVAALNRMGVQTKL